ncbi:thioredoxin-disulfide reductase [Desulfogranum mediterraneum]|uniref:thioredoxin-disulfide reductase n=1 Tax=Desulfogranum mediterraneum TaxID=160661 RepID=UPI0003FDEBDA|nr:thioredoxin-disulfide reductase [Desulfogranum mediterraneum]
MRQHEMHDVVIVGGGPGGLTAGIYAQRAALKTILIEKGFPGGQMAATDIVENWPGHENITGSELADNFLNHAKAYDLPILQEEVSAVEPGLDHHLVHLANGEIYPAHTVIIAVGGSPKKLGIPGEEEYYGKGVSYCAVCDGFFFRNKTVVVVGGGDSATEEALYLAKIAKQVYLVHRRDSFRAGMILQKRVMNETKIKILWNSVLTSIEADDSGVSGVNIQDVQSKEQQRLATDGVFVFIGFKPNNQLIPAGTPMDADGFVMTDCKGETTMPGIYVIGDLRQKYAKQIVVAAGEGATAALAAAHFVHAKKGSS